MPPRPQIERLRILHDLHLHFEVPPALRETLRSQLSAEDQPRIERFVGGFEAEDWFGWTFAAVPWIKLIHGLSQQQFPAESKGWYQVPDFLLVVETGRGRTRPLLVEVKRVPRLKTSLKLRGDQMRLSERYAAALQIPLVYAVYWERFSAWTLNTPDVFEGLSAGRKLSAASAFELDCGLILGDISYLVPPALVRISRYSAQGGSDELSRHVEFGWRVRDEVSLGDRSVEMDEMESAAVDAILTMTRVGQRSLGDGQTELVEQLDQTYMLKLSSWINRHLALFGVEPSEQRANISARVVTGLMEKLACPPQRSFPVGRSAQLRELASAFLGIRDAPLPDRTEEPGQTSEDSQG